MVKTLVSDCRGQGFIQSLVRKKKKKKSLIRELRFPQTASCVQKKSWFKFICVYILLYA